MGTTEDNRGISRRNFVGGALVAGTAMVAAGLTGCGSPRNSGDSSDAPTAASSVDWTQEADIVVVGCGASGTMAALSAAENGASVIVLESSPAMGGSGILCSGAILGAGTKMQKENGIEDSPEALAEDVRSFVEGMFGPGEFERMGDDWELMELHASEAANTVDWLADHGVQFYGPSQQPGQPVARLHMLHPNAAAWPPVIKPLVEDAGVDIKFQTKAAELILESDRVVGVKTIDQMTQEEHCYKGNKGVIMATGSIEGSKDWRQKIYTLEQANVQCANSFNDGSGIRMMCKIGGDTTEYTAGAAMPMLYCDDPAPHVGWYTALMSGGAIMVDPSGKRFISEDAPEMEMLLAIDALPERKAFALYDETIAQLPSVSVDKVETIPGFGYASIREFEERGGIFTGNTIEEVAEKAGVDAAGLAAEVARYNELAASGTDADFGRQTLGSGLLTPPYRILGPAKAQVISGAFGMRVTNKHEVKDTFGNIIPGLYAVGEGAHGLAKDYSTGTGGKMSWAFTSGRLAGAHVASL